MTTDQLTELAAFLAGYHVRSFHKGEIIVFQGEAPRTAYVVKSGVIKAYNLSVQGDEKPVGFYTEQEVFPAPWTFNKAPSALFYYEAFTDVELYLVPREEYVNFLKDHPRTLFEELERRVADHVGKTMRLNALQHSRASDKLIYTLHYLALAHGKRVAPQVMEITLTLTHQDFANLTGLTRETTATELNKLKNAGIISYGKHTPYRIDIAKLNATLNDQFVADMEVNL